MREYNNLYQNYQDIFDTELYLKRSGKTYAQLKQEAMDQEEWL